MPKRLDINAILIVGAGPIIIGQGCEFDYAGVQACKALKAEGYRTILVNSNPATIMTDPLFADATYIEPITVDVLARIIEHEKPDALLPTMGGQTALNCALALAERGVLERHHVKLIGASTDSIKMAEDRTLFRQVMKGIGLDVAKSYTVRSIEQAEQAQSALGFPVVVRPSFTLGGSGGGIAYQLSEFRSICEHSLEMSLNQELLIEESLIGWKEFELEVIRDCQDNCIVVCSIENVDPVGIHTGDSITVAPAMTLTDKEYQRMRAAAFSIMREIGVETGGSNVQFAIHPQTGCMRVIEMNPRVSRSSALASKATGFPIAKVAALLAVGYTLNEIRNDMTKGTMPMSFEPTLDYVVVKLPKFNFEKFPKVDNQLGTQMKSVGEVIALGQNFHQALQKAIVSLEVGLSGLETHVDISQPNAVHIVSNAIKNATPLRLFYIADAFRLGLKIEDIYKLSAVDPWFLHQISEIVDMEKAIAQEKISNLPLIKLKQHGFSDKRLAQLLSIEEEQVRVYRQSMGINPVYQRIDTCAAEFEASTAYMYSTYLSYCEAKTTQHRKVVIIGSGSNRIGQGLEFDYCCVHAAYALKKLGYESIIINCNPETVSTDYDTADRLYLEPLTEEHVLSILQLEQPLGVFVQFGGQTSLKLAKTFEKAGFPILGTPLNILELCEDRLQFSRFIEQLGLLQPQSMSISHMDDVLQATLHVSYPLLIRPSYVLGGRAMTVVYEPAALYESIASAFSASEKSPILLDQYLENALEFDVDVVCDGYYVYIAAIMEHIEPAGIHSGDSACSLPTRSLTSEQTEQMCIQIAQMARALRIVGLMNVQLAVLNHEIYIIEVNPRASRTMPFVSKATNTQIIQLAVQVMLGKALPEIMPHLNYENTNCILYHNVNRGSVAVKMPVFPFNKFATVDPILGPEMQSTGEVMGWSHSFAQGYKKALLAAGQSIPRPGNVLLNVASEDKLAIVGLAKQLLNHGYSIIATVSTANILKHHGVICEVVDDFYDDNFEIIKMITNKYFVMMIVIVTNNLNIAHSSSIRKLAKLKNVLLITTLNAAMAMIAAMQCDEELSYISLQDFNKETIEQTNYIAIA